ncbi:filamentous hemagglutinin family N-terminal domain [Xenococcus sp. PCC 7305]|nr:filamentous hemagglutinin family N-terminal domain [Xenococcus sp. PCC 7305]
MGYGMPSFAQITPDSSLGTEGSIVTPNVPLENDTTNRIDGGAIRDDNIFHSFQEFNVNQGQQVHFANPIGIENIIGRVTGSNISEILGTLGVLGDANLFLLNPNGFIFGQDARLDINGSFTASTSESLFLGNNLEFSATNPQAVPLLTMNVAPGLGDWLNPRGVITNQGILDAGNDLNFIGNSLELEGELQAGNNLTLTAVDNIQIRDRLSAPFIAAAGNQLLVQGDQLVDIFALNNSASGLFAGGDLILRSQNPIITDAYFNSGGNFRIEDLNENLGDATSPNDPIIRANGDVSFNSYTGASLHIFAGGSVNIDSIEITGTDPNNGIEETVILSDGVTTVAINGSTQPTLYVRAGTTNIEPTGIQGNDQGFSSIPGTDSTPNSADIRINQIINPGGFVFLSNQDQPNLLLSGDIDIGFIDLFGEVDGGSVVLDSRGEINLAQFIDVSGFGGNGGDVQLIANGNIVIPRGAGVFSSGFEGIGGNIILTSQSAIEVTTLFSDTSGEGIGKDIRLTAPQILIGPSNDFDNEFVGVALFGEGQGGNIEIEADYLEISGNQLAVATFGLGDSGNISINADEILLQDNSFIFAVGLSPIGGNTGDIEIRTNDLTLIDGSQISSQIIDENIGNSGNINIKSANSVNLIGNFGDLPSGIITQIFPDAVGSGGIISITTSSLNLKDGGQVFASTEGNGNAGNILIEARDVSIDGVALPSPEFSLSFIRSLIVSEVLDPAIGNGGTIDINAEQLTVTNGGLISASIDGTGNAGDIKITATKSAFFDGIFTSANLEESLPSRANVAVFEGGTGEGGTLTITTPSLSVTNGAQLQALTEDSGNAGDIRIFDTDFVLLSGANTGLFSDTTETSTGNAGNIFVDSEVIEIRDRAEISVDSKGTGEGGTITLSGDDLTLDDQGRISATTASTDGGDITLNINDLILLQRESNIATDAGTAGAGGNGGNITINTPFIVAPASENSDITADASQGNGGNIDITATGLFGIEFREEETDRSDITASSEFGLAGIVVINNPDVDPTAGLVELPDQTTDPSDRIIAGCGAVEGNSFTITGRGGLPENPTNSIRGQAVLSDLRDFTDADSDPNLPTVKLERSRSQVPKSIVQVSGWLVNQDGEVELVATLPQETKFLNRPDCQDLADKK